MADHRGGNPMALIQGGWWRGHAAWMACGGATGQVGRRMWPRLTEAKGERLSHEAMPIRRKGQHNALAKGDVLAQNRVINQMFG
jgi:hypothetical protein